MTLNRAAGLAAAALAAVLVVVALLAIPRRQETPRWEPARFETVRAPAAAASVAAETWVVAVQIRCPHCREALARVHRERERAGARVRTVALLVDTPPPVEPAELAHVADAASVYRDSANVWRRWGGRRWGDVFRFGPDGRFAGMAEPLTDSAGVARAMDEVAARH